VSDGRGGSIEVLTYLNILAPAANNPPTVSSLASPAAIVTAGSKPGDTPGDTPTFTVAASDLDGDLIWVVPGSPIPAGLTVTTRGMDVTVAADELIAAGTYAVPLLVYDVFNASTPVSAIIEVKAKPIPPSSCVLGTLTVEPNSVGRSGTGEGPRVLDQDVLVTLTHTGNCYGLVLKYDTGNPSGLGAGVGRPFPSGSPTKILIRGDSSGGSEKWTKGIHALTASTTSNVSPNSVSTTLTVN
jgi:hypothetical protein